MSWTNIIAVVGLFLVVFGGGWTLFQTQISTLERRLSEINALSERRDAVLREELQRRENELKGTMRDFSEELRRRREEFVGHPEFREFQNNANDRWNTQAAINKQAIDAYLTVKAWQAWQTGNDERLKRIEGAQERMTNDIHRWVMPPSK